MAKLIETSRLILRPFKCSDAERYFEMTRDTEILKYVSYACPDSVQNALDDIEKYYSKGDWVHDFYIILEQKESHEIVGALIITEDLSGRLDTCLIVAEEHRRKGYITEAITAFREYLPKGNVLHFVIDRKNIPSLITVQNFEDIKETTFLRDSECQKMYRDFVLEV